MKPQYQSVQARYSVSRNVMKYGVVGEPSDMSTEANVGMHRALWTCCWARWHIGPSVRDLASLWRLRYFFFFVGSYPYKQECLNYSVCSTDLTQDESGNKRVARRVIRA